MCSEISDFQASLRSYADAIASYVESVSSGSGSGYKEQEGKVHVLWLSTAKVDESQASMEVRINIMGMENLQLSHTQLSKVPKQWRNVTQNARIRAFNAEAERLSEARGFHYVDLYRISEQAPPQLWGDAVHVSGKGDLYYGIVADMVWKAYTSFQKAALGSR